jgi:hypothetical protein
MVELVPTPLATRTDSFLLIAPLINQPRFAAYRVDILTLDVEPARVLWSSTGLRRRDNDTFELLVPRAFLNPGRYQLVIYGVRGSIADRLARFTFRAR